MKTFENWCVLKGVRPFPAAPQDVADFISDCAPLGIKQIWPMVGEISQAHYLKGLADPTLGDPVSAVVNDIAEIAPPRSWPKEHKPRFLALPYDLQVYVAAHEAQREKVVRRAQSETANAKQKLEAI